MSYTPLHDQFRIALDGQFFDQHLAPPQVNMLKQMFFAGAVTTYAALTNEPLSQGTLYKELVDYAGLFDGGVNAHNPDTAGNDNHS